MDTRPTFLLIMLVLSVAWSALRAESANGESPVENSGDEISADDSGQRLLQRAIQQLAQASSISAKLRHQSQLFEQRLVGTGSYLQRAGEQGLQVRLSLSVRANDRMVSLLHLCDGRFLWMSDNLGDVSTMGRVDLLRVRSAAAQGRRGPELEYWWAGGLPRLLEEIEQHFLVSPPQAITFQDVPVWALACRWNPERLTRVSGRPEYVGEQGDVNGQQLPEQLPDQIFLLLGQDDLFPYHIDFRRTQIPSGPGIHLTKGRSATRSLVTMELFEVQMGQPLDPVLFTFAPGNVEIVDQTEEFIARLRARREAARIPAVGETRH